MMFVIKKLREERKMSQSELSFKSAVSRQTISGLESGKIKKTSTNTLQKIATALEVEFNDLFFENDV